MAITRNLNENRQLKDSAHPRPQQDGVEGVRLDNLTAPHPGPQQDGVEGARLDNLTAPHPRPQQDGVEGARLDNLATPHPRPQQDEVSQPGKKLKSDGELHLAEVLQLSAAAKELLNARPDVVTHLAESYRALYLDDQVLTQPVRHALAAIAARRQGNEVLAQHHGVLADPTLLGEELPQDLKLEAIIEHVDLITVSPGLVEPEDQYALQLAGVTPEEIVLISQIVAYTSTLVRVIDGYALLAGGTPEVSTLLTDESATSAAQQDSVPQDSTPRDPAALDQAGVGNTGPRGASPAHAIQPPDSRRRPHARTESSHHARQPHPHRLHHRRARLGAMGDPAPHQRADRCTARLIRIEGRRQLRVLPPALAGTECAQGS